MYPYIFQIKTSLIFLFFGIVMFGFFLEKYLKKNKLPLNYIDDYIIMVFLSFFLFGRFGDFLQNYELYSQDFLKIFYVWNSGGFNFMTGSLGSLLALYFFCLFKKEKFWKWMDASFLPAMILFCMISLGNFFNGTDLGIVSNLPFAVSFDSLDLPFETDLNSKNDFSNKLHPVQLYEFFGIMILSFFILNYSKIKKYDGQISSLGLLLYFLLEFFIQFFRSEKFTFEISVFEIRGIIISVPFLIYFGLIIYFFIFFILNSHVNYHGKFLEKPEEDK